MTTAANNHGSVTSEGILSDLHKQPVIPVWLCSALSGRHRNQMYRLINERKLVTKSICGTKFVTVESFTKYMHKRKPKVSKSVLP